MIPNGFLQSWGLVLPVGRAAYSPGMMPAGNTTVSSFLPGLGLALTKFSDFVMTVSIPKVSLVPLLVLWHNLHNSLKGKDGNE